MKPDLSHVFAAEELGYLFEKKDIKDNTDLVQPQGPAKVMSGLTKQLENVGKMGENPFMEYARFDGRVFIFDISEF